jgi:hypothetical protein
MPFTAHRRYLIAKVRKSLERNAPLSEKSSKKNRIIGNYWEEKRKILLSLHTTKRQNGVTL